MKYFCFLPIFVDYEGNIFVLRRVVFTHKNCRLGEKLVLSDNSVASAVYKINAISYSAWFNTKYINYNYIVGFLTRTVFLINKKWVLRLLKQ